MQRIKAALGRLDRDENGNVFVLYIAASLLLVAMLWAVIGTGARLVQKETIQTSADTAAFSAAVIKAKGMNIIAFCNLVMALLTAIILLLRMIKWALTMLAALCAAQCANIYGGEALCAMLSVVEPAREYYTNLQEQLEPRLIDAMEGLAKIERAVDKSFPALALVEAYQVGTHEEYKKHFGKGSLYTVAWPLPTGKNARLLTKDGEWSDLCDQADNVVEMAMNGVLNQVGMPALVSSLFSGFLSAALSPTMQLMCGSGDDKPEPLLIADDWKDRRFTRAYTMLSDSSLDERRSSVQVATKDKQSAPALSQLLATAQSEIYAFNGTGHEDLWHMNWRARMVRYTMSNDSSEGGTGDAASGGVSEGAASGIASKLLDFAGSSVSGVLGDFSVH